MSISLSGLLSSPSLGVSSTSTNLKPLPTETEPAEQKFLDYMKMSPAERLYDAILSQLGLTKDEVNAMGPEAKKAVEEKIQQMIKQEAERSNDKRTGLITDVSV